MTSINVNGHKLTNVALSGSLKTAAKALDDKKETGDAGDVRVLKASPEELKKLSYAQLSKLVITAAATPGYVDDKGKLPSDQHFSVKKIEAGKAFAVLRDAFENTDDKTKSPDRTALEGTIRDALHPMLAGKDVQIFAINMPDDGYGALSGLATVDKAKGEIRIMDNTVIP
jgi:hypothetical protein